MGEVVPFGADAQLDEQSGRIADAFLDCVARWGLSKTTADDVARAAGISRATLYRAFPGGKELIFQAAARREAARFFALVTTRLDEAEDVEELLVVGITEAARFLYGHEALRYLLVHEPDSVLPDLAFDRLSQVLAVTGEFLAPHLARFVPDRNTAGDLAEWLVRILLSYATNPSAHLHLADEASVARFTATYLIPVLEQSAA